MVFIPVCSHLTRLWSQWHHCLAWLLPAFANPSLEHVKAQRILPPSLTQPTEQNACTAPRSRWGVSSKDVCRSHQRGHTDHYQEAAMRMADLEDGAHPDETREDEDDSGASEADLLCSEVLSESHDEGSDVGSDALYRRRYSHHSAQVCTVQRPIDIQRFIQQWSAQHPPRVQQCTYCVLNKSQPQTCAQPTYITSCIVTTT